MASGTTKLCLLLLISISIVNPVCTHDNYTVMVRSHSFSNPSNRCFHCQLRCCDDNSDNSTICTGSDRCDIIFTYYLCPFGSASCTDRAGSGTAFDDRPIDFTQSTVLGLPNPLPLSGASERWEGATLYIRVTDDDSEQINRANDIVDYFVITINSTEPVNVEPTTPVLYHGRNNFAEMELSIWVVCPPDFMGAHCETTIDSCIGSLSNCSGNGQCINRKGTFTCDCCCDLCNSPSATSCKVIITTTTTTTNQWCVIDSVNSFTCNCESSYTSETAITTSRLRTVVIAGSIIGGILFILLVLVHLTAIAAVILKKRKRTNTLDEDVLLDSLTNEPGTQNAAYGLVVDGVSTLEMNVAYGVVDPVMEKNEAYGAPIDGIHSSIMRPNIAYNTGAITTHEDSGGYVVIYTRT